MAKTPAQSRMLASFPIMRRANKGRPIALKIPSTTPSHAHSDIRIEASRHKVDGDFEEKPQTSFACHSGSLHTARLCAQDTAPVIRQRPVSTH
jgi:hypothetical protein